MGHPMPDRTIDLNCDLGEGTGEPGLDRAMMPLISSANIACGYHAGDTATMREAVASAAHYGVRIGAHPSFADREGFGRRPMANITAAAIERLVVEQIVALQTIAAVCGHRVTHVKPHGALSNMACADDAIARPIAAAIKAVDPSLVFVVLPLSAMDRAAEDAGLAVAREIYADRAYDDAGMLVSRALPGAVLSDPDHVARRVVDMVQSGKLDCQSGKRVPVAIDTVCVHGDTPGALIMARGIRRALEDAGIAIAPFAG